MSQQPGVAVEFSGDGFSDGRGWTFHASYGYGGHSLDFVEARLAGGTQLKIVKQRDTVNALGHRSFHLTVQVSLSSGEVLRSETESTDDVVTDAMTEISAKMNMGADAWRTLLQNVQDAFKTRSKAEDPTDDCIEFAAGLQASWMADGMMGGDRAHLCPDYAVQRALIPKRKKVMLYS